jgi:hypothetical protein
MTEHTELLRYGNLAVGLMTGEPQFGVPQGQEIIYYFLQHPDHFLGPPSLLSRAYHGGFHGGYPTICAPTNLSTHSHECTCKLVGAPNPPTNMLSWHSVT